MWPNFLFDSSVGLTSMLQSLPWAINSSVIFERKCVFTAVLQLLLLLLAYAKEVLLYQRFFESILLLVPDGFRVYVYMESQNPAQHSTFCFLFELATGSYGKSLS